MADAPQTESQLIANLANTIGAQVEFLMDKTGWAEANNPVLPSLMHEGQPPTDSPLPGTPEAAAGQPTPAPSQAAPVSTSATPAAPVNVDEIDWEQHKDANGLYLGKYKTKAEAVKGYYNVLAMTKTERTQAQHVAQENARLRAEVAQLRQNPTTTPAEPAPAAAPRGSKSKVAALLAEKQNDVLDPESVAALVQAIEDDLDERVSAATEKAFSGRETVSRKEQERWARVDAYMLEKYPQSKQFTDEFGLFVQSDPIISAGVNALIAQDRHEEATERAWLAFQRAVSVAAPTPEIKAKEEQGIAANLVRKEVVDEARRDAGVIPAGVGGVHGVHEAQNLGPTREEREAAINEMRQGHGARWRDQVFGPLLNHPLFD